MDTRFRSLSKQAADCQRHIFKINSADSNTVHEEIANLIKSNIRKLQEDIKSIEYLADEEDRQVSRNEILTRLGEYETQCRQLQIASRQAILKSKQRIQKKEQETREALFGNSQKADQSFAEQYELRQRNARNDDSLLRATSNVTEALQRTSQLMQQELEKSSYSASTLADSSKTLSATLSEYQNLGSLLTISKRMITHLETSDWFDRLILFFGVAVFCFVVIYIIKKRTYDVGKSWLTWVSAPLLSPSSSSSAIISPSPVVAASPSLTTLVQASTSVTTPLSSVIHTIKDEL